MSFRPYVRYDNPINEVIDNNENGLYIFKYTIREWGYCSIWRVVVGVGIYYSKLKGKLSGLCTRYSTNMYERGNMNVSRGSETQRNILMSHTLGRKHSHRDNDN